MSPEGGAVRPSRTRGRRLAVGLLLALGGVLLAEATLRLAGFEESYIQYDSATRWSLRPGFRGRGPALPHVPLDYEVRVNSLGFRGSEFRTAKAPGVFRYVALGDSVTFGFGVREADLFSAKIAEGLAAESPSSRIEAVNAGVPGFTSLQGLRHLEARVLPLRPDLVSVFFGWNDGWRTSVPDAVWIERLGGTRAFLESSRLYALFRRGLGFLRRRLLPDPPPATRPLVPRVPPESYEANLLAIFQSIRRAGATPILLTAPASFGPDRPPEAYFKEDWTVPRADLEPLRLRYAEAARRAAGAASVTVADCARLVSADPALFYEDGYHPRAEGHLAIAEVVVRAAREAGILRDLAGR
ncbi:MAG: GDSL-type esterase/lipase family protein [Planctomycetes bacterium]|nr:GDSL-type esterase/lipase family protein [Planctomycetota bacterium]